jgi:hypothetical protein
MSHVEDLGLPAGLDSQQSTPLTPKSFFGSEHEHESDIESCATTVPETVMAEQVANDVVKEAQSVGRPAPIDDTASATNTPAVNGEPPAGAATTTPNPPEASSTKALANGTDAASADSAHVAEKADGQAAAVSRDGKERWGGTNSSRARTSSPAHHNMSLDIPSPMAPPTNFRRPSRKLWQTRAVDQTPTSAAPAALISRSGTQATYGRTRQ